MDELSKSAAVRALRSLLQVAASFLTVEVVEMIANAIGGHFNFDPALQGLLVAVLTALYAYLHRRVLDPSPVPSLPDPAPQGVNPL